MVSPWCSVVVGRAGGAVADHPRVDRRARAECVSPKYASRSGLAAAQAPVPQPARPGQGLPPIFWRPIPADFAGAGGSGSFFSHAPSVASAMIAELAW